MMQVYGGNEVPKEAELPDPVACRGDVVIKLLAAGYALLDHYSREGSAGQDSVLSHVLGSNAISEILDMEDELTDFATGHRVLPMPRCPIDPDDELGTISRAPSFAVRSFIRRRATIANAVHVLGKAAV